MRKKEQKSSLTAADRLPRQESPNSQSGEHRGLEEDTSGAGEPLKGRIAEENVRPTGRGTDTRIGKAVTFRGGVLTGEVAAGHPVPEVRGGGGTDTGEGGTAAADRDLRLHQRQPGGRTQQTLQEGAA
jgi:hypothetical protein